MPARWKHPNDKNRHEQMLVRCALVAYYLNFGASAAANKFNCSIPSVYQWFNKIFSFYPEYWSIVKMTEKHQDYETYVIFD